MREIKLSLKDAREREERNRGENKAGWWEYCHHTQDNFGAIYGVHPPHKPGWHRAPDLAMLKSRPVDPPRERDYAKLTEAAKRKDAPFVDWNGPSSDPCLKYAGIGGGGHASPPASGSGNLPDAAPAPAPVADSAVGEFEPRQHFEVGDMVLKPWNKHACMTVPRRVDKVEKDGSAAWTNGSVWGQNALRLRDGDCGATRILKRKNVECRCPYDYLEPPLTPVRRTVRECPVHGERKNVAARAWKLNTSVWVVIRGAMYRGSYAGGAWKKCLRVAQAGEFREDLEIHDPAEIQRLVAELHAAGLGK